ncbi:unnamed protein product [Blepharisma stoltei]|uniref:Transmembrane protein n=1 Tax=Blepharisma stoltei TaxID=1481888 RepID=A0AAU9IUN8_9CILI|nr:unnamed protein product [Blepharisma stoltei]
MVDYSSIPDWLIAIVAQKPKFNMQFTEYEEKLVASRPDPKLPEDLQKLFDNNPEEFKKKCLLTSYSGVDNYRENFVIRKLLLLAYKKNILPEFGATSDEKDFISARRWYNFYHFIYNSIFIGAFGLLNFAYVLPRFSAIGLPLAIGSNASLYLSLMFLKDPFLHNSKIKARIAQYRVADKYKEILLKYHQENRLLYRFHPRAVFPPNPLNKEEKLYDRVNLFWKALNTDPSDLENQQKTSLLRYKSEKNL